MVLLTPHEETSYNFFVLAGQRNKIQCSLMLAWIERSSGSFHKREVSWARGYIYMYDNSKESGGVHVYDI